MKRTLLVALLVCACDSPPRAADNAPPDPPPPAALCAAALDAINAKGTVVGATELSISVHLSTQTFRGGWLSADFTCPLGQK